MKSLKLSLVALLTLWLSASLMTVSALAQDSYRLGSNDRVKVTVFGEDDLTGEFEVDGGGSFSFPMIGTVRAQGLSPRELESAIRNKLLDGYLVNPQVSVEVLNYRDFYIIGEVNKPGSYPYRAGMTVIGAVALAGGFTYRADEDDIVINRGGDTGPAVDASKETSVMPEDVIRVKERFF